MNTETDNAAAATRLQHTPLFELHEELGAKFAPFAGFSMPIAYDTGIVQEHLHTRANAGLFDVSHMGQIELRGENVAENFNALVPSDVTALAPYRQRYSVLTNDHGGIIDDVMISRLPDGLLVVANAAFKHDDLAHINARLPSATTVELREDRALLALQGPAAVHCLAKWDARIVALAFMRAGRFRVGGIDCLVHRCGYTGGDGFELSVAATEAAALASMLLADPVVAAAGLGARDTLRLEAGLCLAGVDFDQDTTPVEAALEFVIAKKYRNDRAVVARFPGAAHILAQLENGVSRRRVGLRSDGRAPVRAGTEIQRTGRVVGTVTSGSYAPSVGKSIAMAYVDAEFSAVGNEFEVVIRGRSHTVRVCELPFLAHSYFRT